jgi:hypothetical protein
MDCAGQTIDLTPWHDATPNQGYYDVHVGNSQVYYFHACGTPLTSIHCTGDTTVSPVGIQTWLTPAPPPDFPQNACGSLGSEGTRQCMLTDALGLECTYTGGKDHRSVSFFYECAATAASAPQACAC